MSTIHPSVRALFRKACGASAAALLIATPSCFPDDELEPTSGECRKEPDVDCTVSGYVDGELLDVGLVGYTCTGDRRPDDDPTFKEGVPEGLLCADRGPVDGDGPESYCCTPSSTTCALDPVTDCEGDTVGYQCWSSNRPESLNAALKCSNGYIEDGLVNYCCSGTPEPPPCQQTDAVGCEVWMMGFLCQGDQLPRGEDLGPNKSRADYFHPACSMPEPAPNPEYQSYCCFMPAPRPLGGTCVSHSGVPGCDPGRFGFACYGPDRPEENNLPMICEDGFAGTSAEGYDATLFCCDARGPE